MNIEVKRNFLVTEEEGMLLSKLLNNIEDIQSTKDGTLIKFKGNLVILSDDSMILQSSNGYIVQMAECIHLNPILKEVDSVEGMDRELKSIQDEEKRKAREIEKQLKINEEIKKEKEKNGE